jgi:hypothetical protein
LRDGFRLNLFLARMEIGEERAAVSRADAPSGATSMPPRRRAANDERTPKTSVRKFLKRDLL